MNRTIRLKISWLLLTFAGIAILAASYLLFLHERMPVVLFSAGMIAGWCAVFFGVFYIRIWLLPQYTAWVAAMEHKFGSEFRESDFGYGLFMRGPIKPKRGRIVGRLGNDLALYEYGIKGSFRFLRLQENPRTAERFSGGTFVEYRMVEKAEIREMAPGHPEIGWILVVTTHDLKTCAAFSRNRRKLEEAAIEIKRRTTTSSTNSDSHPQLFRHERTES